LGVGAAKAPCASSVKLGNPPGADQKFGDDAQGNMIWTRGGSGGGSSGADPLIEGQNIKSAGVSIQSPMLVSQVDAKGKQPGTDKHWGPDCMVKGTVMNPFYSGPRKIVIACEQPTDLQGAQMRATYEQNLNMLEALEAVIEVQGWLTSSGQPWINLVNVTGGMDVTLYSPMVWPTGRGDAVQLKLKGVKHLQDSEKGTRSELTLCIPSGLGDQTSTVDNILGSQ